MPLVKELGWFRYASIRRNAMKRLAILTVIVVATALATPVLAQESVMATGTIEEAGVTTYMYGTHVIVDEQTGTFYALGSDVVDLDIYAGQRVTVYGALVPGYEYGQVEGGPPLVDVAWVEPASL